MVNAQFVTRPAMPALQPKSRLPVPELPQQPISPLETVRYASDLLENLRRMAAGQGLSLLAHLLELAQTEARMIVRDGKAADEGAPQVQATRFPG
jgi:hypothetical protein